MHAARTAIVPATFATAALDGCWRGPPVALLTGAEVVIRVVDWILGVLSNSPATESAGSWYDTVHAGDSVINLGILVHVPFLTANGCREVVFIVQGYFSVTFRVVAGETTTWNAPRLT